MTKTDKRVATGVWDQGWMVIDCLHLSTGNNFEKQTRVWTSIAHVVETNESSVILAEVFSAMR